MGITHTFTSPKADGADTTLVRPSDWNADHDDGGLSASISAVSASVVAEAAARAAADSAEAAARDEADSYVDGVSTNHIWEHVIAGTGVSITESNESGAIVIASTATSSVLWAPPAGMRLSASNNTYVPATDVTGAGTIYWTPATSGGNGTVTGYNGSSLAIKSVTQKSLALTVTADKNYDVFYDYDGDALALSSVWTNDTTRADALADEQGAIVLGSDHTKLWLGTIRASGSNVTEDSGGVTGTTQVGGKRFVWNAYNQVDRAMQVIDTTGSWSYKTATWRQANDAAGNKVEYVTGDASLTVSFTVFSTVYIVGTVGVGANGVGIDSTTAPSGFRLIAYNAGITAYFTNLVTNCTVAPGLGYHYAAWLEKGGNSTTMDFVGHDNSDDDQTGLIGQLRN